jgi:TolB-like protein/Tfp pilus assembly protein PilF
MRFRFEEFELDPELFELRRDGLPVELQRKAFDLLLHLLRNPERTVGKRELLDALWPDAVVEEGSLARAVSLLRRALDDSQAREARAQRGGAERRRQVTAGRRIVRTVHTRGYRLGVPVQRVERPRGPGDAVSLLPRPAVAVLAFSVAGGEPDQEYFADGIAEDLITLLACWRRFPVIARNSSFAYRGTRPDVRHVGAELGARYVLEGSVRRAEKRVRITALLSDAASGLELWADHYDGELSDVFALQDRIATRIVAEVEPTIEGEEERRVLRAPPESLDGWDCCLRARWHLHRGTREGYGEARRWLERAIELDPESSWAHSLLAHCHFEETLLGGTQNLPVALSTTLDAARRAVALDERDSLAHALLGIASLWAKRDHERAIEALERSLELDPSSARANHFLGCVLLFAGRPADGLPRLRAVPRLDPRYRTMSQLLSDTALCHLQLDDPDEAVRLARAAIERNSANVRAHQRMVAALARAGRQEEARAAAQGLRELQPGLSREYLEATYPFRDPAQLGRFLAALERAGLLG